MNRLESRFSMPAVTTFGAGLGGMLLGGAAFWAFGLKLTQYAIDGDPLQLDATFRSPTMAILITLIVGGATIAAGAFLSLDETWKHVAVMSLGLSFLLTGVLLQTTQRIVVTPDGFKVRQAGQIWGMREYRFDQLERLWIETIPRPGSRFGDNRKLHYQGKDGTSGVLCRSLSSCPLWEMATPHLLRGHPVLDPNRVSSSR